MQGTETTLDETDVLPRRALRTRTVAIVALALIAVPLAIVIGGRQLLGASRSGAFGGLDTVLEEAREAERRHAWDGPPGRNFKELTDLALARWPQSTALRDLRRDGADRLLADALGRKYANDPAEALRLVRIALELNPDLTAAQHLAAELAQPKPVDAPSATAAASASAERLVKVPRHVRDAKPRESHPIAGPSAGTATGVAVVPPDPPPMESNPRPAARSPGPWL
jgi:serine/threonine-protein kinase